MRYKAFFLDKEGVVLNKIPLLPFDLIEVSFLVVECFIKRDPYTYLMLDIYGDSYHKTFIFKKDGDMVTIVDMNAERSLSPTQFTEYLRSIHRLHIKS